jgi:hypothetical protein
MTVFPFVVPLVRDPLLRNRNQVPVNRTGPKLRDAVREVSTALRQVSDPARIVVVGAATNPCNAAPLTIRGYGPAENQATLLYQRLIAQIPQRGVPADTAESRKWYRGTR